MTDQRTENPRSCTCHPDDRPPVCQHRYAASECQQAYRTSNPKADFAMLARAIRFLDEEGHYNEAEHVNRAAIELRTADEPAAPTSKNEVSPQWLRRLADTLERSEGWDWAAPKLRQAADRLADEPSERHPDSISANHPQSNAMYESVT